MCKTTFGSSINEIFKQLGGVRGQFSLNFNGICVSVFFTLLNRFLNLLVFTAAILNCILHTVVKIVKVL